MTAQPLIGKPRPQQAGRVLIVLAIVLFALSLRSAVTSLTPLLSRISTELGFGSSVIGAIGMLPALMFASAGFIAPALGRRFGLERLALCAAVATVAGTVGRAAMSDVVGLLTFMMLALAGMGIGNIVIPPLIKRYFSDRLALMSAVFMAGVQLGTIVPAAAAVPLADAHGWRISLAVWGLIPLASLLPWALVSRGRGGAASTRAASGQTSGQMASGQTASDQASPEKIAGVWRSPVTQGLTVMFAATSLMTYSMFTWIPQLITTAGGTERLGGEMVAVFSMSGLIAAFLAPALCARLVNPFPVVVGAAICFLIGFAGLLWWPLSGTFVWVLILGLGPSTFPAAMTLINLRCRTGAGSAALSGFMQGGGYLIASLGPLVFGILHELSGRWTLSFGFLLAAVAALLFGGHHACKPRFVEDTLVRS
jgi:CP family cyanate transporter-like MFS transporter